MTNRNFLIVLVFIILCVAVLHYLGFYLQLYWRVGWYDRVVHTLGGIWIALTLFYFLKTRMVSIPDTVWLFFVGIGAALIVGIIWEFFEVKAGITVISDKGYLADTVGDIISDVCGGLLASVYAYFYLNIISWKTLKN